MIARVLQREGWRVAVVPQPNWQDDLRDFRKLGVPRLFFGVNSGAMDSMVNHYTAAKRLRSNDAYTPGGQAGHRPDYAVTVYTRILKRLFPDVPVVIGGIEASLRRLTHYDYWADRLFPSVLVDSGADLLIYGMGERPVTAVARAIAAGEDLKGIPQTAFFSEGPCPRAGEGTLLLHGYERVCRDKDAFIKDFNVEEREANRLHPATLIEPCPGGYVQVNPPYPPETVEEIDSYYALPFTKQPHPRYRGKDIPAWEMIKNSITIHRGCFGGCSFCTIAAHQGKFIRSRSPESIVREVERLTAMPHFKGIISDVGAPTANMYGLRGRDASRCARCSRPSCLFPSRCPNMEHSHRALLELYSRITAVPGVRKAFIGSGIRYEGGGDQPHFRVVQGGPGAYGGPCAEADVQAAVRPFLRAQEGVREDCGPGAAALPDCALFHILASRMYPPGYEGPGREQGTQGNTAGAGAGFHPYAHDRFIGDVLHRKRLVRTAGFRGEKHPGKENPKISFF